ncbi:hypothetical protein HK098_002403 [Nowakowskiella sp. JEL0407]|nr:hypothetical protein HK098_002403 [Nowakowskiella sp. JEL0407]
MESSKNFTLTKTGKRRRALTNPQAKILVLRRPEGRVKTSSSAYSAMQRFLPHLTTLRIMIKLTQVGQSISTIAFFVQKDQLNSKYLSFFPGWLRYLAVALDLLSLVSGLITIGGLIKPNYKFITTFNSYYQLVVFLAFVKAIGLPIFLFVEREPVSQLCSQIIIQGITLQSATTNIDCTSVTTTAIFMILLLQFISFFVQLYIYQCLGSYATQLRYAPVYLEETRRVSQELLIPREHRREPSTDGIDQHQKYDEMYKEDLSKSDYLAKEPVTTSVVDRRKSTDSMKSTGTFVPNVPAKNSGYQRLE